MDIDALIDDLIKREGGYSDHRADRGGRTRWGITEAVARAHGYEGAMERLPRATAAAIYTVRYWSAPKLDAIAAFSPSIAEELFDTGVNMGPGTAIRFLQRALNALNRNAQDYADIIVDGRIGPRTLSALQSLLQTRSSHGADVLKKALEALQGERYIYLAEKRPANEAFLYGWLANRIGSN